MNNCLMDVWCELEPKTCKINPKGYRLKIEDYMPILIAETSTGISAVLGVVLYLTFKQSMYELIDDFGADEPEDLEKEAAKALRRYLCTLKDDPEAFAKLPLFEPDGVS